jgi:hypothetical protein
MAIRDRGVTIQREPAIETIEYQKNLDAVSPYPVLSTRHEKEHDNSKTHFVFGIGQLMGLITML